MPKSVAFTAANLTAWSRGPSKCAKGAKKSVTGFGALEPHSGALDCDAGLEEIDLAAKAGKKCLPAGRADVGEAEVERFEHVVLAGRPPVHQLTSNVVGERVAAQDEPFQPVRQSRREQCWNQFVREVVRREVEALEGREQIGPK